MNRLCLMHIIRRMLLPIFFCLKKCMNCLLHLILRLIWLCRFCLLN
ncbi:hypothetical protein EVA_10010 [gut metagenome]|uniref:Uncharacterized protein n=1 Tax=gut metagenome TaxID=749906 RepID=J9G4U1_9ZZZZ